MPVNKPQPTANHAQPGISSESLATCWLQKQAWNFSLRWSTDSGAYCFYRRWSYWSHPLQLSSQLAQSSQQVHIRFSQFMYFSCRCVPPRHFGNISLTFKCSLFSGPQNSSVSSNRPLFKMAPGHNSWLYSKIHRGIKWSSSPMLAYHARGDTVIQSPYTGLNACKNCGLILC
jgi:hypothetical protein